MKLKKGAIIRIIIWGESLQKQPSLFQYYN